MKHHFDNSFQLATVVLFDFILEIDQQRSFKLRQFETISF